MEYLLIQTSGTEKPSKKAYQKDGKMGWFITLNTIQEIEELINEVDCEIIIGYDEEFYGGRYIEIYNDYRE